MGNRRFPLEPGDIEWEQDTVLYDLAGNVVFSAREFIERDLFAGRDPRNQAEIGRRQQAEVLAILLIYTLDVFGYRQFNAGGDLGIRRLLAAGPLASALARYRSDEPTPLDVSPLYRKFVAALEPKINEVAEGLIKMVANVCRSHFVS